jgi:PhnB protein
LKQAVRSRAAGTKQEEVRMSQQKPSGYSAVSPYLIVDGAEATMDFLKRVFDAIEMRRFPNASGGLKHAEVGIANTVIMLADPILPDWPPVASHVHIYVRDVDATYRKALEAGAASVQEPRKKQGEDKRGGVRDAGGTTWWIATKAD